MSLLTVEGLEVRYGPVHALKGITLSVPEGRVVTLIGSNGAGKTTTIRAISGLVAPTAGDIKLDGRSIVKLPPHERAVMGIGVVPEGRRIFAPLTVEENLRMGTFAVQRGKQSGTTMEEVYHLFPRLRERSRQVAGTLSGGEQQMLAIGRALMGSPRILLMDEPSLGLAPQVVDVVFEAIGELNRRGITILLVEQNAHLSLEVANYGYVLETGKVVLEAPANVLVHDERIAEAYLGVRA